MSPTWEVTKKKRYNCVSANIIHYLCHLYDICIYLYVFKYSFSMYFEGYIFDVFFFLPMWGIPAPSQILRIFSMYIVIHAMTSETIISRQHERIDGFAYPLQRCTCSDRLAGSTTNRIFFSCP